MQTGAIRLNKQIIDGPRPFAEDQCSLDDLRGPVRSHLLTIADAGEELGFHSRSYSVSNSRGVDVHGGAIRMLHDSGNSFLQILASASGTVIQGYEIIVSATTTPVTVFASTNGRPNYRPPSGVMTHRRIGASLKEILDLHTTSIAGIENLMRFGSFADVGTVMDHLSNLFYTDKIERGIFMPES